MKRLYRAACQLRFWADTRGQDLIEYALMAGFVAVSAGAVVPAISASITKILNSVETSIKAAGG